MFSFTTFAITHVPVVNNESNFHSLIKLSHMYAFERKFRDRERETFANINFTTKLPDETEISWTLNKEK